MRILGILKNRTYAVLLQKDSSTLCNEKRRTSDIDKERAVYFASDKLRSSLWCSIAATHEELS